AYLVGSRGTARHALILGLIVTASHTAGVYLLGGITFYASQHVVPERLYPWVALGSGLTIAALGLSLFVRRLDGRADAHGHDHHHHHHHGGHDHGVPHHHGGPAPSPRPEGVTPPPLLAPPGPGAVVARPPPPPPRPPPPRSSCS